MIFYLCNNLLRRFYLFLIDFYVICYIIKMKESDYHEDISLLKKKGMIYIMSKKYKIFSNISLIIVGFYCLMNAVMMLGWGPRFDSEIYFFITDAVLFIDLWTWHIYGLFAIISLIIKVFMLCKKKLAFNTSSIINIILHFLFSVVSFFEIYWIFENSF